MAAPLVVSFWMRALFTFVDIGFAKRLGDASVAAIGLSFPFEFLMIAVWVGLSTGLTSNLSRAMGAREDEKVAQHLRAAWRLVVMTVPVFALLGASCWFLREVIAPDAEVARQFGIFGTVLIGGSAFSIFWSVIPDSVVKAHGDTRSTMWAGIWSNVTNVALNVVFTIGFEWGILGIALSTVLGRFAGLAYALHRMRVLEAARKERGEPPAPGLDPHPYRSIFALAVPGALAYALMASESQIVNWILKGMDHAKESIAAYAIYYRVFQFVVMPAIACAVAMLPYAARRFGEKDAAGMRRGLNEALVAGVAYCAIAAPILVLGSRAIAAQFANEATTRSYAEFLVRLVPLGALLSLPLFLCRPMFEGMGRGKPGLAMALLRYAGLAAPAALGGAWLARSWGAPGLYGLIVGLMAATAATSVVFLGWSLRALRGFERAAAVDPASNVVA